METAPSPVATFSKGAPLGRTDGFSACGGVPWHPANIPASARAARRGRVMQLLREWWGRRIARGADYSSAAISLIRCCCSADTPVKEIPTLVAGEDGSG